MVIGVNAGLSLGLFRLHQQILFSTLTIWWYCSSVDPNENWSALKINNALASDIPALLRKAWVVATNYIRNVRI